MINHNAPNHIIRNTVIAMNDAIPGADNLSAIFKLKSGI